MPIQLLRQTLAARNIDVAASSDIDVVVRANRLLAAAMDALDDLDNILERNPAPGLSPRIVRRPNDEETVRHIRIRMSRFRTSY